MNTSSLTSSIAELNFFFIWFKKYIRLKINILEVTCENVSIITSLKIIINVFSLFLTLKVFFLVFTKI